MPATSEITLIAVLLVTLLFGAGGYVLFTAIKLKTKACLFPNKILYPANCPPAECTDPVGFMSFMIPRLFILGAVCIVAGILCCLNEFVGLGLPEWLSRNVMPFVGVPVFIWFIIAQNKASKLFW